MNRWIFLFLLSLTFLEAKIPEKPKKYNLSICAIFKNEGNYLKEWIEYHQLIGVNHFYLYNNRSTDSYQRILAPYVKKGIITLIHWPGLASETASDKNFAVWPLSTQVPAYENAIKYRALHETKWLVILDINEFLVPTYAKTLTELLKKYDSSPGVIIPNDCFDSSKDSLSQRKLLIETTQMTKAPEPQVLREVTKMIFKPDLCKSFTWPPYTCSFKNGEEPITIKQSDFDTPNPKKSEIKINRYVNRGLFNSGSLKPKMNIDNRFLTSEEVAEILNQDYEIEDQERPIYRYIQQLKKKLGFVD